MNQQSKSSRREDERLRDRATEHLERLAEMEEALRNPIEAKHGIGPDTLGLFAESFFVQQLKWYEGECEIVLRRPRLPAATRLLYQGLRAEVRRLRPLVLAVVEQDGPLRSAEHLLS